MTPSAPGKWAARGNYYFGEPAPSHQYCHAVRRLDKGYWERQFWRPLVTTCAHIIQLAWLFRDECHTQYKSTSPVVYLP